MAESARRAGYEVTAIDAFGDLDLRAVADDVVCCNPYSAARVARLAARLSSDAVAYNSNFENNLAAVARLARGGGRAAALWGNRPDVLGPVRNPLKLARSLARLGFAVPATRATASAARSSSSIAQWLLKPRRSGGGHAIRPWTARDPISRRFVLQERIRGVPASIIFAADGSHAVPLGLSRQLTGDRRVGATGYRYSGSVLTAAGDPMLSRDTELLNRATALAAAVTRAFGLVGVNGIDFIARGGIPYPVEVNPRYTASMELSERHYGISIFAAHAGSVRGSLPDFSLAHARAISRGAVGKAIVYARRDVTVGDTQPWLSDHTVRDIPPPSTLIPRGRPICTVFATGRNGASCYSRLIARAARVYAAIA
jgi:predicted ATP-grasp superfamily ATP-dependent carboligase